MKQKTVSGYRFGQRTWYTTRHLGVDYKADYEDLYAPFDGIVIKKWGPQGGNTVWFNPDSQPVIIRFMHLSKILKTGKVKKGDLIAVTGNTGLSRGAHLHIDISRGTVQITNFSNFIDPEKFDWETEAEEPQPVNECYGTDISHWQGLIDWGKLKRAFVFIKATQGTSYVDERLEENKKGARENGILAGFYHFAYGGDPKKEAEHFVESVGELKTGELLALDWEIGHPNPPLWCHDFLDKVFELTGIRPLLYTNEARVKQYDWSMVVSGNYGLWVAKYGINNGEMNVKPASGQWPFWVIWQYTSRGSLNGIKGLCDLDYCKCSIDTLKKYGKE